MYGEAAQLRMQVMKRALATYHAAVFAAQRETVFARVLSQLQEASRVVHSREGAGVASGYERARLNIALRLAESRREQVRADVTELQARLAVQLGVLVHAIVLPTALTQLSLVEAEQLSRADGTGRQDLKHAQRALSLAERAQQRAAFSWLPELELSAGLKRADSAGSANGYGYALFGSLSIPVFDRGQGERATAGALYRLARARREAMARAIREVGS